MSGTEYINAFNSLLRTKAREDFKLLLCDLEMCEEEQIALLKPLLFEINGHTLAANWGRYIAYTARKFTDKSAHLQRLINKALEFLGESENKDDQFYLALHLRSAHLKPDHDSTVKYFESVILKKKIGLGYAALYTEWAKAILLLEPTHGPAVFAKGKKVLEKGIELNASPQGMMKSALAILKDTTTAEGQAAAVHALSSIITVTDEGKLVQTIDAAAETASASSSSGVFTAVEKRAVVPSTTTKRGHEGGGGGGGAAAVDEDDTLDMQQRSSSRSSTVEKPMKPLGGQVLGGRKVRLGGLGMIGKVGRCQRVVKKEDDDDDLDSSREMSFDTSRVEEQGGQTEEQNNNNKDDDTAPTATATATTMGRSGVMDMSAITMNNNSVVGIETIKEGSNRSSLSSGSSGGSSGGEGGIGSKRKSSTSGSDQSLDYNLGGHCNDDTHTNHTANNTGTNKLDLSKYIDDKLLNFDPSGVRSAKKRSKTSGSSSSRGEAAALNSSVTTVGMSSGSTTNQHQTSASKGGCGVPQSATKGSSSKTATSSRGEKRSSLESNKENHVPSAAAHHKGGDNQQPHRGLGERGSESASKPSSTTTKKEVDKEGGGGVRFATSHSNGNNSPAAAANNGRSSRSSNKNKSNRRSSNHSDNDYNDDFDLGSFSDAFKMVCVNNQNYLKFGTLGKGGSSCVYSVISQDSQVYAFKKVFVGSNSSDPEALFDSYVNEIDLLNSLKGSPFIIQLVDSEVDRDNLSVSMIMEAGEIDLSKVLKKRNQVNGISPFFIRMIWTEMLESVDYIHENRIVHGDLKPANFVFVKGHLKLIDFGIAKSFSNDTTNIYRDSQIGTINYMAPEAIVAPKCEEINGSSKGSKLKLGRASDVWSLGCILYQLVYGQPPFAALNTIQKLHAIPNPNYDISYPSKMTTAPIPTAANGEAAAPGQADSVWHIHTNTIDSMKACLMRDPVQRSTIKGEGGLLSKAFLTVGGDEKNKNII